VIRQRDFGIGELVDAIRDPLGLRPIVHEHQCRAGLPHVVQHERCDGVPDGTADLAEVLDR
jgi:hypothetical protein